MATIEHILPVDIKPRDGAIQGVYRPGMTITEYDVGPARLTRDWFGYNLATYRWTPTWWGSSTDKLKDWTAFLRHIRLGGDLFWIKEQLQATHHELVIGPIADGTRTSFVLPIWSAIGSPSDLTIFEGGALTEAFTAHGKSNILTDAQANAVGGTTGMQTYGTCSMSSNTPAPAADGETSFEVTVASAQANVGVETTVAARPACSTAQIYTFFGAFKGTGSVQLDGEFYTSVPAQTGPTYSETGTMSETGWTIVTKTAAASPGDAATAHIRAFRTTSSANTFHIGCLGVIPGDLTQWFLPSLAPMVLEMDSAPADRTRLIAAATCTRMTPCRLMTKAASSWSLHSPGSAQAEVFTAIEEIQS